MPHWLDIVLMFLLQGVWALVCLLLSRCSLRISPTKQWMRALKPLAVALPLLLVVLAISSNRGLLWWLACSPLLLALASVVLGWGYWLSPRTENGPIRPEMNILGASALAAASLQPIYGLISYLRHQPGESHLGNWIYIVFVPLWAVFGLVPGLAIAVAAWNRDWRREGDDRWV